MNRLAKLKYTETQGCRSYLVMRANWIDHWVKAIQSGLVNSLARGMVRSYTDLAAQHAVTSCHRLQTLSPPKVSFDNPGNSAENSSISLITITDVCEGEDIGQTDIENSNQATSPSLISSSQEQCLGNMVGIYS